VKLISIDIETTGLDHSYCQTIEFGAVIDDLSDPKPYSELPQFHCYIDREGKYQGEPYALAMHAEIFRRIAKREEPYLYVKPFHLERKFSEFLVANGAVPNGHSLTEINVVGKNFAKFDLRFLENDNFDKSMAFRMCHRNLDPGSLYFDPKVDRKPPDSKTCMKRAGLDGEVAHTALEDAMMVVKLIRKYYKLEK
jgi:oligoribonuclease